MVYAAVLAAGRGTRFGGDKLDADLGGRQVWRWALESYRSHPEVDRVILVVSATKVESILSRVPPNISVIAGGETRQASAFEAAKACQDSEIVLIHDGARPFVSSELISRTIAAVRRSSAAAPALKVTDTIKEVRAGAIRTLDRTNLYAMQTPQGSKTDLLIQAFEGAEHEFTDEMALLESVGVHPEIVVGESSNIKITTAEDLVRARNMLGGRETRTGIGYDIHPFSDDPLRPLYLGGIHFPGHLGLAGHSDADVLLHAATDALLGAAGLGDIGVHFPNADERWKDKQSTIFLSYAAELLTRNGWSIVNLDITAIAESPKIMANAEEIRAAISRAVTLGADRVSVKATTNEQLGAVGRGEGIAAIAIATIARPV